MYLFMMWWFLMRFYVMLCMILMVCICYCCFDNFQMVNFLSTTIFYYNPKISFFMMNLVWEYPNIKIHSKVCQINRLEIALTNHVLHLGYMNRFLVGQTCIHHVLLVAWWCAIVPRLYLFCFHVYYFNYIIFLFFIHQII